MSLPIAVVGSINLDLVFRSSRPPSKGETIFGESFQTSHGGKGANQAVGIARLGHPVVMLGCVGQDAFGIDLRQALTDAGVGTGAVQTVSGSSGVALIQLETDGANRITVVPGANAAVQPGLLEVHLDLLAGAAMVLTQLETPLPTLEALAALCQQTSVPLMLDPAPAQSLSPDLLRRLAWLTPNATEALTLLGQPANVPPRSPEQASALARRLRALGPASVLLKLGAFGSVVHSGDDAPIFQPAFPIAVKDTTAAGDSLNAAFATALVRGLSTAAALRFASAAAALCVSRAGAQQAMPSQSEVERFIRQDQVGM